VTTAGALPRSYLYVPGNAPDKMPKAWASDSDAVVVDLEDAVPFTAKEAARDTTRAWIDSLGPHPEKELWVRINPGELGLSDVAGLAGAGISGIMLAKASVEGVSQIEAELDRRGLDWMLSPLLETPTAVFDVRAIARSPRVRRLQLGEYDLCAEAGITPSDTEVETLWARSRVVMASAEAAIEPPVAPVSVVIRDSEAFAASTRRAARQGFVGRACIHPAQIAVVHEVYTPSADALRAAEDMLRLFEERLATGAGVAVDEMGRLVDEATVRGARRTLALAGRRGDRGVSAAR
jgi:citrate lyase subunit beta/citryl-CoA lyase